MFNKKLSLVVFFVANFFISNVFSQIITPYSSVYSANAQGDITLIGNQILDCKQSNSNCPGARIGTGSILNNSNFNMLHINVDSDSTTFNSSSSTLSLPAGSSVLYAGLYWGGLTKAGSGGSSAPDNSSKLKIKIQPPTTTGYLNIGSGVTNPTGVTGCVQLFSVSSTTAYGAFCNITGLVQKYNNGTYTIANLQTSTGSGSFGGWTIIIAYQNANQPTRNLNIFNGGANLVKNASLTIPISGFLTPSSGDVKARIGTIAYDGAPLTTGDSLSVNGKAIFDALNPANNIYSSVMTILGNQFVDKTPNFLNMFGYDAKIVDTLNYIPNGATSTIVTVATKADAFYTSAITSAIDIIPQINATKTAVDINGGNLLAGDFIDYTITLTNTGAETAANVSLQDVISPFTNASAPTNITVSSGNCSYIGASSTLNCYLGTGATGSASGQVAVNDVVTVKYRVAVNANVANQSIVRNSATVNYRSISTGQAITAATNETSMTVAIPILSLSKTSSSSVINVGENVTYTINYSNQGSSSANNVVITDVLPAGITHVSNSMNVVPSGQTLTFNLGDLPPGSSGSIVIVGTVGVGVANNTLLTNNASIIASGLSSINSSFSITAISQPYLTITKTSDKANVSKIQSFSYTINYKNQGTATANNVSITDNIPSELVIQSVSSPCTFLANTVSCLIGDVGAGVSGSLTITVLASGATIGSNITNTANISSSNAPNNSASSTVSVIDNPVLTITKTADRNIVSSDDILIYTINYANIGQDIATNVSISDPILASQTFISATGGGVYDSVSNTVNWNLGSVGIGASGSVSVKVQIANAVTNGMFINNQATIQSSNAISAIANSQVVVYKLAELKLDKTTTSTSFVAGDQITYTLTYQNTGNDVATGVVISDALPAHTTFVSASSGGIENSGVVTWDLSSLSPGVVGSVTLTLLVDTPLTNNTLVNNSATMSSTSAGVQPVSATNSVTITSYPNLTINKVGQLTTVLADANQTYTINYANIGTDVATAAKIVDTLPNEVSYVSALGLGATGGYDSATRTVTWDLGDIEANTSGSVTLTVKFNASTDTPPLNNGDVVNNTASISSNELIPTSSSFATVVSANPNLSILKTSSPIGQVNAGDTLTYTIVITNTGNAPSHNTIVVDNLSSRTTFVSASNSGVYDATNNLVTWNLGPLSVGATQTLTVVVQVNTPLANGTKFFNTAIINSDETQPLSSTIDNTVASEPNLQISKTVSSASVSSGSQLTYSISYSNIGSDDATGVVITDNLASSLTYNSASQTPTQSGQALSWNIATLAAGSSGTIDVVVDVANGLANGTALNNTVDISASNAQPLSASVGVVVSSSPLLSITKQIMSPSITTVNAGDTVTYQINYSNIGNGPAVNTVVSDFIPVGMIFVSATGGGVYDSINNSITWDLSTLSSGASGVFTVVTQVANPIENNKTLVNRVNINADNAQSMVSSVAITSKSNPILSITKSAVTNLTLASSPATNQLSYTINYDNTGTDDAHNVVITDTLPSDVSFVSCSNSCSQVGDVLTWNLGDLTSGTSSSQNVDVIVPSPYHNNSVISNDVLIRSYDNNNVLTSTASSSADTTVSSSVQLSLIYSATQSVVPAGNQNTYTVTVTNPASSTDILNSWSVVTDIPSEVVFLSTTEGVYDSVARTVSFDSSPALQPGESTSYNITVLIPSPNINGTVVNSSSTVYTGTLATDNQNASFTITSSPVLTLNKSVTNNIINVDEQAVYTIDYSNLGNSIANNAVITDVLPAGITHVSNSMNVVPSGQTLIFNLGDLPPGSSGSIIIIGTVDISVPNNTLLTNNANIIADGLSAVNASIDVTAISLPYMSITKTPDQSFVSRINNYTYTINYKNEGTSTATDVRIDDFVPSELVIQSVSSPCTFLANTVSCLIGDVGTGVSGSLTITVLASGATIGSNITNTANISSSNAPNNSASSTVSVIDNPVLTITKTADRNIVSSDDILIYTINYANIGQDIATNVSISDPILANQTFISATGGGVYDSVSNTVNWNLGSVGIGASGSVSVKVQIANAVTNGMFINNQATIQSSNAISAIANSQVVVYKLAELKLDKTTTSTSFVAGDQITYTLTYQNTGNDVATGVVISDALPAHTTFVSASSGGIENSGVVTWDLSSLSPGVLGSVTLTLLVDTPLTNNTLVNNSATMSSTSAGVQPVSATNSVTITSYPNLTINKVGQLTTVLADANQTYTISYANIGTDVATAAKIVDTLPNEVSYVSALGLGATGGYDSATRTVTWDLGDIEANTSGSVTLTVKFNASTDTPPLNNGDVVNNTASISSNELIPTSSSFATVVSANPNLSILKTSSPIGQVNAGDTLTYTIVITNTGNAPSHNTIVVDNLSSRTTFVSASNSGVYDATNNLVTWNLGPLSVGATQTLTVVVQVNTPLANGTKFFNTAIINSDETQPLSSTIDNTVASEPNLQISKTVSSAIVASGSQLTYSISYSNIGSDDATGVVITDNLASSLTYNSASQTPTQSGQALSWNIATLAAGSSGTIDVVVDVANGLANGTALNNTVDISASNAQPLSASVGVVVSSSPLLSITKQIMSPSITTVNAGDTVTYQINYSNIGNGPAVNTVVSDFIPVGMSFVSATGGGVYDSINNSITWDLSTLASGASGVFTVVTQVANPIENNKTLVNRVNINADNAQSMTASVVIATSIENIILELDYISTQNVIDVGGRITYMVTITNSTLSTGALDNWSIITTLPQEVTFLSSTQGDYNPTAHTVTFNNFPVARFIVYNTPMLLQPGESITYNIEALAPNVSGNKTYTSTSLAYVDAVLVDEKIAEFILGDSKKTVYKVSSSSPHLLFVLVLSLSSLVIFWRVIYLRIKGS